MQQLRSYDDGMTEPFRTRRMVEFADTDMAGIAHFSVFYRWMESAEHELVRSVGLSIFSPFPEGSRPGEEDVAISFPRVHASCDFKSPVRCEDVVDIDVSLERLGTKSISYAFAFSKAGEAVASGRVTCVCCRVPPGGPVESVPVPEAVAAALRPHVVSSEGANEGASGQ
ncbi:MAG: thioesterase family protein [Planctomycetota bacterium]